METSIVNDTIQSSVAKKTVFASQLAVWLDRITLGCLHLAVFLIPLWFLPFTVDVLELNKQTLLIGVSGVAFLAWLGASAVRKTFSFTRSWLHVVVAVFFVTSLIASLLSHDRYLSLAGNVGQMAFAFATIAALAAWYLVAVNTIKTTARTYDLLLTFLGSGVLVAIFGLCQALGLTGFNPLSTASGPKGFYTVGTMTAFGGYAAVVAVVASSLLVLGCKNDVCLLGKKTKARPAAAAIVWTSLVLSVFSCIVADVWTNWAVLLLGTVFVVAMSIIRRKAVGHPIRYIVPGVLSVLSVALLIWASPFSAHLPGDVTPSPAHSWQVVTRVLQDSPLFGTGPGTWVYDYAQYHAPSANLSPFWSMRFDQAYSSVFSMLATFGVIGTIVWLFFLLSGFVLSAAHLVKEKDDDLWQAYVTVFSGWMAVAFFGIFSNFGVTHHFLFWFFLALLAALSAKGSFSWDGVKRPFIGTLLHVLCLVAGIGVLAIFWLMGQRSVAAATATSAAVAYRSGGDLQAAIEGMQTAAALNRLDDGAVRNLSQAYLIQATQAVQSSDAQKTKRVADAVHAAIDAAKRATSLNPANVDNWSNLALVYQTIASYTAGADELAIQNYREALKREPNNPTFSNEIAKIYILRADAYRTLLSSTDDKTRTDAEKNMQAQFDLAAQALNDAIQAKQDFAPAHYTLGILYERQGHLREAIAKLEQVLSVHPQDVGIGFQLAVLYYRNSNYDKAQYVLEQIERIDPSFANAPWYLSSLYADAGRYDDALSQLRLLKKLYPDNADVATRMDAYQKLKDAKSKPAPQPIPEPIPQQP